MIPSTSKGSPIGLHLDENFSLQQPTWLFTDGHYPEGGLVHLIIGSNCPSPFSYFLHRWPNRKVVGCPVIPCSSPAYILSAYRQRKSSLLRSLLSDSASTTPLVGLPLSVLPGWLPFQRTAPLLPSRLRMVIIRELLRPIRSDLA